MRICPHCGNQIPDENNNIYCPYCNHIADEEVLLRMRIEKKLHKPEEEPGKPVKIIKDKEQPAKLKSRHKDGDDETLGVSDDRNPYLSVITSVAVILVAIAAAYFLIK